MLTKLKALALALFVPAALVLTTLPAYADNTPADYPIEHGHFYTQGAGGAANAGFSITDDGGIPMWTEYQRLGGPDQLGYPISGRFVLGDWIVQLTQKVGLIWRADLNRARFLNIFTLLHDAGKDPWLALKGIPPETVGPDEPGKSWDQIAQERYSLLDLHPPVKDAYFGMYDPVNMFGLPISNWLEQPQSSVLRFERVAFQQWKESVPWAPAGTVQLVNGGDLLKESGILGPLPFVPQSPAPAPALQTSPSGFAIVSYYSDAFIGLHTSMGLVFSQDAMTCASNQYPLGTKLRLTTPDGDHSVVVTNTDRPPSWNSRIDLTKAAFSGLYPISSGIGTVKVEVVL
ncbi:MAG TPA: septal ring lytic transglycosylase RlpA family protein [Chloroflexota bacterium]|nr:septal ring lytic transglycosylase RlpA family protein [Chloroflexota bacterium]